MSKMDPKRRFSDRVEEYHKHRPAYPSEIINILRREQVLQKAASVADIGSGTGMLSRLFFDHAKIVYGVEPNDDMRKQAEKDFKNNREFQSVNGSAENTTLLPASIDLITAAQAFHWFNPQKAYREFKRILCPDGAVALVWNYRDFEADDFQREYEEILKGHITDYKKLDHKTMTDEKIQNFFRTMDVKHFILPNSQRFDLPSLKGRVLSSSYVPKPPDPMAAQLLQKVELLFDKYQQNGLVNFVYKTNLYLGRLH